MKTCLRHLQTTKAQTSLGSLISANVIHKLIKSIISSLAMNKISFLKQVSEYHFVGNPEDRFTRHAHVTARLLKFVWQFSLRHGTIDSWASIH